MRGNKVAILLAVVTFLITSFLSYQDKSSASSVQRPTIMTVEISKFDKSNSFPYTLGLGMTGSSDAITMRDSTYEFKGWVDPAIDKIGLITTKTLPIGINQVNFKTTARPDVALYYENPRLEFSGYSFSLNKSDFGEVVCIYISRDNQVRLLYVNEDFKEFIPSPK